MSVALSKFYLSTAGSYGAVRDNLLPADPGRPHRIRHVLVKGSALSFFFIVKKRGFLEELSVLLRLCCCGSGGDRLRLSGCLI